MNTQTKLITTILTASLLTACGGGSDSGSEGSAGGGSSNTSAFNSYMTDLKQEGLYYTARDTNNGYYKQKLVDMNGYQTMQTNRYEFYKQDNGEMKWEVINNDVPRKLDPNNDKLYYETQNYNQLLADGSWLDYTDMQWRYVSDGNALLKQDPAGNTVQKTTVSYVNNLAKTHGYPSGSRAYSYRTVATTDTYLVEQDTIQAVQDGNITEAATSIAEFIQSHTADNPILWNGKVNGSIENIAISFVNTVDTATTGDAIFRYCSTENNCVEDMGTWQVNDVATTQAVTIIAPEQIESGQKLTYIAYQNDLPVLPAVLIEANTVIASGNESDPWDMPHNQTGYNHWQDKYFDFFPGVLD